MGLDFGRGVLGKCSFRFCGMVVMIMLLLFDGRTGEEISEFCRRGSELFVVFVRLCV